MLPKFFLTESLESLAETYTAVVLLDVVGLPERFTATSIPWEQRFFLSKAALKCAGLEAENELGEQLDAIFLRLGSRVLESAQVVLPQITTTDQGNWQRLTDSLQSLILASAWGEMIMWIYEGGLPQYQGFEVFLAVMADPNSK